MVPKRTWFLRLSIVASSAILLPSAMCVSKATQTIGDGITAAGTTGVLGNGSQAATAIGTGLHFLGDIVGLLGH